MLRNETGKGERHNSAVSERQGVPKGYSARKKGVQKLGSSCRYVPELRPRGWEFLLLWCMTLNLSGGSGKSVWWLTILYM